MPNSPNKHFRRFKMFIRICIVFLSIVFFPLGIFMLGYLLGSNRAKKAKQPYEKTETEFTVNDSEVTI